MSDKERFLSKSIVNAKNGCMEWASTMHRDGYGKFWFRKSQVQAHRVSWILHKGEIPNGMFVLHKCDNRKCTNPDHLYIGTAKDNVRDKLERCAWHGNMRMPFDDVLKIRDMYATGKYSQQELADIYHICQTQVSKYIRKTQRSIK